MTSRSNKSHVTALIRQAMGVEADRHGYQRRSGNIWVKTTAWCIKRAMLNVRTTGLTRQPVIAGGASIFLPQYDSAFRRAEDRDLKNLCHLGAPAHWIDPQLDSEAGRFDSLANAQAVIGRFAHSFEQCIFTELERFQTEDDLFELLRASDWAERTPLSTTPDTRGALLALMMAKREGVAAGLQWAEGEVARIRALRPLVTSQAEHQNLLRVIAHLQVR